MKGNVVGNGSKIRPGHAPMGIGNGKCSSDIGSGTAPSAEGQTSGVVEHNRMSSGKKIENLDGFPKSKSGKMPY